MRKGEIAYTSNFSFSLNIFHSYISLVRQYEALCGNGSILLTAFAYRKNVVWLTSIPNDKFLDWSNLKAFADDKIIMIEKVKEILLVRVENIVGKGENAGYQHFLLCFQMFSKGFYFNVVKSRDCVVHVKS